jgi:porphobilinogen synthase
MSSFPQLRLRRLRRTEPLRSLIRESHVDTNDLVYPLFIASGKGIRREIPSMPGIYHLSVDKLQQEIEEITKLKIPAILLFGIPDKKDELGSEAYNPDGIVQQAIKTIKIVTSALLIITDVCLCEYTNHGHCGVVQNEVIDNDKTLTLITQTALSHAAAGADMVAPSDMMDGRVKAIRKKLDESKFEHVPIMSYSAKYASAFYGPFRDAANCKPQFGDRRSYQMDTANTREAQREVEQDILEGADIIMIKPALPYLDIIRNVRDTCNYPIAAYNVSGEYAMVKAAGAQGWLDEKKAVTEILTSIKRAGADIIITYHAKEYAQWLQQNQV